MRKYCFPFVIVIAFSLAARALGQQEHPNRATGERSETLYAQSGQDAVNVFNGNLSYRIPIGEGVQAGPNLRLAPVLVFNSTPLRHWNLGCNTPPATRIQESYPSGDRIFGHGWQMHFGRVVPVNAVQLQALIGPCGNSPQTPSGGGATQSPVVTMNSTLWGYQEPDGAVHEFFDRQYENVPPAKNCWTDARTTGEHCFVYTHDGSFLRMDPKDPEYGSGLKPVVYFPDGTRRVMGYRAGRTLPDNTAGPRENLFYADIAPDFAPGNFLPPAFHSTEIADPFGNKIVVRYYGDGVAPAHPLAAYSVPTHQWDAIPYQAYADSYTGASYYFDVTVDSYSPISGGPSVYFPYVSQVRGPSSAQAGTATYTLPPRSIQPGGGGPASVNFPILPTLGLPTGVNYSFAHALSNQPPFLTQVTLPSGGLIQYDYTDIKLATKQPNENPCGAPSDCYHYEWDTVTGVKKRRAVRNVRTSAGGATTPESAETTYFRTYLSHTDPVSQPSCAVYGPASCQMRVDQWTPVGVGSGWNVTRSTFYESDGYTNTALYGRPFQIDEFFPAATTPSRAAIDDIASTPVRRTLLKYDHDGLHLNPPVLNPDGHSHNTRETCRQVIWCGGGACAGTGAGCNQATPTQRNWQIERFNWDNYGHFGKVVTSEATTGSNLATLRSVQNTYLKRDLQGTTALWILDPLTSRTTSSDPADSPPAAVSSTEAFNVNQDTGFVQNRTVTANDAGDSRVLTTTWAPGTQQSAPCLPGGSAQAYCNNRGFPITETTQLTGSRTFGSVSEPSTATSFTRSFFYQYGSPSAWYDSGTSFYGLDNDLSVCGRVLSARGSEGRTSLTDPSPHSTTFEYDTLGRITKRTPYGEWPETTVYAPQTTITKRCGDQACSSFIGTSKSYFDELGRPTVSLRSMPGANAWSYKVATYDTAGRTVSGSQWQALTCDEADPCSAGTTNLLNLQAAISGSGSTSTVNIAGTIRTSFGLLGIPQYTIQADGSLTTSSPTGWWQVQTTRSVNQPPSNATYTYNRDALGRLTSVVEPATTTQAAPPACMNNADTTTYTYDAFDRLVQATKAGTDAACGAQANQTRTWAYDDFGWLVSEQTPEVPNYEVRQRDGRGNVIVDCTGPTSSCGPAPADHSTQDRVSRCYDPAGRLLSSTRAYDLALHPRSEASHCTAQSPAASYEDFFYDAYSYPGVSLNFGRSNGRLVYSVRHNLVNSNRDTNFFGWFAIEDLYQYSGVGDRLNQRQLGTFQVGGLPSPLAGRLGLGASKPAFSTGLADYFTAAKRKIKKHDEGLATAATTTTGATPAPAGRVALDAYNPNGWFRWYWYYDPAGRPYQMVHPRRDESTRTWVQNAFDRGWLTSASVTLTDPFNPSSSTAVTANLAYNPSGTQSQVTLFANPGTQVYSLRTPDDGSMGRIGGWLFDRGAPTSGNPYGTGMEYRGYSYDGSGNVTNTTTGAFTYDFRSRLTKFVEYGITQTRTFDSFGNLWRVDDSTSGTQIFTPEMATNRHVATGSGVSAAYDANRGTFVFDSLQSRNVGRDYYADGRPMSEYGRTSGNYTTTYPAGISLYLDDAKGERAFTFHGDSMFCDTELFRHSIRDESGRVLTDYKADHQSYCDCSAQYQCAWTDRFERDYVWLGSYTQLSIKRGDVPHFTVLDHLGSPRHQLNSTGAPIGINVLDAWGTQVSVNQPERTRYTGHERNNVDLDGPYLPISDYMHARTYVPMLGRFTSPDVKRTFSLFNPAAMNRYLYAASNPTRFTDPTGFAECQGTRTVSCQESETVRPNDPDEGVPTFNPTGTLNFLAESFNRQVGIGTAPGSGFVPGRFTAVTPILPASVGLMTPVAGVASPDDVLAELDWPYLEDLSNGSAGFGDGVSFGVTSVFRPEGVVDPRSASYLIGLAGGSAVNAALSGPKGPLFGRMRYRNGIPGLFNQGPLRLGWFWSQRSGRNWFGPHWGTPGSQWHGHLPLVPGPKGPAW